jgi:hypothetical protein
MSGAAGAGAARGVRMRDADNSNERAPRIVPGEPARASSARERCKAGPDRQVLTGRRMN